jgi:hypothetical protein
METTLDLSRWRTVPHGVAYRRWVIMSAGLRQLFATRLFRVMLSFAWSAGMAIAAVGFLFSQSVATGGWLESLAVYGGPRMEAMVTVLGGFVTMFPDVCIGGMYTLIFWGHSYLGLWLSLVALTVMVASFRQSVTQWLDSVLPATLYVRTSGSASSSDTAFFDPRLVQAASILPGVERLRAQRTLALTLAPGGPRTMARGGSDNGLGGP